MKIGGRSANHEKALEWVGEAGKKASQGTFADAARFGGSGYSTATQWIADGGPWHGFPHSLRLDLPPLSAVFLSAVP